MKSFGLLKLPVLLLGFGAGVLFAPACKAQAEVSPDHFDGTESWVAAPPRPAAVAKKHSPVSQAKSARPSLGPTLRLSSAQDVQESRPELVAIQDKRRASSGRTEKK